MDTFLKDARHASRMFVRAPSFTLAAIAALALGIAGNTAVFSVVNTVLLKPFEYRDPGRIVMFQNIVPAGRSGSASPTEFNWWRRQTGAFEDVSAYDFAVANWTGESFPEQVPIMHASADFFRLCGANAIVGSTFSAADDVPGGPKTVVLAFGFWQRRFGGDRGVTGRRMTLNGERYEIIGVVGPEIEKGQIAERSSLSGDIEIDEPPDVYLPFQLDPESAAHGHSFNVAGRVKAGVTLAAANAQLQASYPGYVRRWPEEAAPGRDFLIQPLEDAIAGGVRNSLLILLGAVGMVLLIACANVANLLLSRATGRKREIAIRAAVGAGRARVVRQLMTESVMLSVAGGMLGLAGGFWGIRALLGLLPGGIPRVGAGGMNVGLDWRVLVFTLGLSVVSGMVFGLAPALASSRLDLNSALKENGRGGAGFRQNQTRALLVACEMALAVVLLAGAGMLIRSFLALREVNPGFEARNVLTMRVSLTGPAFARPEDVSRVIHEGLRRIRAIPGVEGAAATCCVPLEDRLHGAFQIAGRPEGPASGGLTGWSLVSAGYFETLKMPVLRGRAIAERDESGPPVILINETLAKRYWPNADPLRDRIHMGNGPLRQIIGVVGDVREEALGREPRPNLYIPSSDGGGLSQVQPWAWLVRTRPATRALSSALEKELREASGLPVAGVRTMEEVVARSTAAQNFNAVVLTIFGCAAVLLAAIGIYGVMAYSVAQRVPEIGIRLALGARASDIRAMVVWQGLRPALAGVACGLAAAFALTRAIAGFLYGVKAWDPPLFFAVPVILTGVALVAAWLPAARASRVAPIDALRYD